MCHTGSIRTVIPLLLCLIAQPAAAGFRVGAMGGLVRTSLSGDAPQSASYKHRIGVAAGFTGELDLGQGMRLSVQPMFQQRGTTVAYEVEDQRDPVDSLAVRLDYWTVPVLFKIFSGGGRTFATGGIEFGFLQSARMENLGVEDPEADVGNLFQDLDVALSFGFGGVFPFDRWSMWVEGRYSQSIPNLSRSDEDPELKGLPERFRSTGLQLYVGVDLPLGPGTSASGGTGQ
jgi:hypothetical protein